MSVEESSHLSTSAWMWLKSSCGSAWILAVSWSSIMVSCARCGDAQISASQYLGLKVEGEKHKVVKLGSRGEVMWFVHD